MPVTSKHINVTFDDVMQTRFRCFLMLNAWLSSSSSSSSSSSYKNAFCYAFRSPSSLDFSLDFGRDNRTTGIMLLDQEKVDIQLEPVENGSDPALKNSPSTTKPVPPFIPSLEPYLGKLERFELFSTNQCYYLVGCNKQNTSYRVLKMDRTMIERSADVVGDNAAAAALDHPEYTFRHASRTTSELGPGMESINPDNINSSTTSAQMADNSHTAKPTLRPLADFLTEDPNVYCQEEIKDMLDMIHDGNRMTRSAGKPEGLSGGLKPIVKAYGIVGFIRFLDCYYLTLTTRRAKVGSIGDHGIYTIKNTETIPLKPAERLPGTDDNGDPSSVLLSMWNRGKRSVGLGLTNREIAELRYQGLYQVVDLTKNFFFSYSYDLTRSLQENFLSTTTKPFPPPPFEDMYAWNFFLTREFECCLEPSTRYFWIMPIIHGAYAQRKVNDYGRYLNITLIARRSRHFAGTRYLKRGVNEQGQVANDVEHEQVIHDESLTPGSFSSYLQVRGSIPTFWTQESSVTMPKPPIELNRVDLTYTATQLHFSDLFSRYSSPILVLDLVKQSEKREREVRVGNEFRHAIDYSNKTIDTAHKIRYCALDYSHISKHRNLDVSFALNEVATWAVNQTGFFCSAPKWKIEANGMVTPFTSNDSNASARLAEQLGVPVFPMEQNGILRTNCIDCLDRTNVAQFSAGVEAMGHQLVVMGIRSNGKLGPTSSIVRVLIDLYVDIGDSIALQYGGSEAHKKVSAGISESTITGPIGKHKELLTSIRRYYSNAFTDRLKQDSMNLFLGYYLPFRHLVPLWEMENDYYLHNFHSSGFQKDSDMCHESVTSMKTYERAYGLTWREDEELADLDVDTSKISHPRNGSKSSHPCTIPTFSWDTESSRVKRVRNKCEAQNTALSLWWKLALQSHIEDRLWVRLGKAQDESVLPGRYERVYQPDKLSQFDRFFSRTWETPVRRSHAAQHYETGDDDEAAVVFSRVLSSELTFPSVTKASKHLHQNVESGGTLKEFTTDFGFSPHQAVTYAPMFAHQFKNTSTPSGIDYLNRSNTKSPPEEYVRYCSPYKHAASNRAEVFKREMHDYSLSADDVTGIRELARRAHLSATIADGEYRCLHMSTSSIYFASIVQEQLNTLESLSSVGLTTVDEELECPALHTIGMKESVTSRWESFKDTERQYAQVVKDINPVCQRSALSTADALQLYISQFDEETILSKPDRIFLRPLERFHEKLKHERLDVRLKQQSTFVEKAGRLGIHITPHEIREAAVPPPLYHSDRRDEVSVGFEQINEDMFSRSDNKFMVFNSAGVDSWSGTTPVTKISHVEDIIRSTIV